MELTGLLLAGGAAALYAGAMLLWNAVVERIDAR